MSEPTATEGRQHLAELLLQEAVYRSRETQATSGELRAPTAEIGTGPGNCGLGAEAVVELDLSPRGRELYAGIWPAGLAPPALEAARAAMADWVRRQDALDRKRNHFMKDFRGTHGFDRAAYTPEQEAAWRAGLDRVNAEVDEGRAAAANALLKGP